MAFDNGSLALQTKDDMYLDFIMNQFGGQKEKEFSVLFLHARLDFPVKPGCQ